MTTPSCTRRRFLQTTTVAGTAAALAQFTPSLLRGDESSPAPVAAAPSWIDKPMRWAQLTLVEDDPGKFDLGFWLDYFRRTQTTRPA